MPVSIKKVLFTIVAGASIFAAMAINESLSASQLKSPPKKAEIQYPVVSVEQVSLVNETAKVFAYGEVQSRNQLALTSQVSGKVAYLSPKLLSGNSFAKGELLVAVEDIEFEQALAVAKASLAEAKLALAQEELNNQLFINEQKRSKGVTKQSSQLQLAVAQANYYSAQKNVEKAKYDLNQTQIIAPFDALVINKNVQIGGNIQAGETLATLYDTEILEVALPLSAQQWQLLPSNLADIEVVLIDESTSQQWQAKVERSEQHVNAQSRQRALIATLKHVDPQHAPLFSGTFVKAEINGKQKKNLWKLPASALIDGNKVWQVDTQGLLAELPVNLAFSNEGFVYVQPQADISHAQVVKRPLASYLANMKVEAKVEPTSEFSANGVLDIAQSQPENAQESL